MLWRFPFQVRRALRKAEKELEDRQNAPLAELQQWLQITYELESKHYDAKKEAVERHLMEAKEMVWKESFILSIKRLQIF